jgi:hypothetical protein
MSEQLMGYSMKAKEKREFVNAKIEKTAKGGFMVRGCDKDSNNMCAIISETNALKAIKDGVATQAF